jgi:hypothetical protein
MSSSSHARLWSGSTRARSGSVRPRLKAPLAVESRLSRSSRLGTHTRSIQAYLRAARFLTTSSIMALHRGHAKPLFGSSTTRHTTPGDRVGSCISPVTTRQRANGFYMEEKRGTHIGNSGCVPMASPGRTGRCARALPALSRGRGIRCRNAMRFWTFRRTCLAANER